MIRRLDPLDLDLEHRRHIPHLTIARLRRPDAEEVAQWLAAHALLDLEVPVERVVLYSSVRNPAGARYRKEAVFRLAAGA